MKLDKAKRENELHIRIVRDENIKQIEWLRNKRVELEEQYQEETKNTDKHKDLIEELKREIESLNAKNQ